MWWASFVISLSITIMNTYLLKGNYCITMFNVKNLKYIKTWTKSAIIKLSNIELFLYLQLFEYWIYFVKFVKFVESIPCYSNPCLNGVLARTLESHSPVPVCRRIMVTGVKMKVAYVSMYTMHMTKYQCLIFWLHNWYKCICIF